MTRGAWVVVVACIAMIISLTGVSVAVISQNGSTNRVQNVLHDDLCDIVNAFLALPPNPTPSPRASGVTAGMTRLSHKLHCPPPKKSS